MDWTSLLIYAVIITVGILLLSSLWKVMRRFIKILLVVVVILICLKLAIDFGWISGEVLRSS